MEEEGKEETDWKEEEDEVMEDKEGGRGGKKEKVEMEEKVAMRKKIVLVKKLHISPGRPRFIASPKLESAGCRRLVGSRSRQRPQRSALLRMWNQAFRSEPAKIASQKNPDHPDSA